jgi:tetratricopeptide (TPR) repeat protein
MKKTICESCMLWIISLLFALDLKAQVNEMPITSSSHKASNFFYQGRANLENLENTVAIMLFNKAIELDPKFAMAYLYRAQSGGGFIVYRKNLGKAIKLSEKVTIGEKLQIMAAKAEADGDLPKQHEYIEQLLKEFPTDKRIQMLAGNYLYDAGKYAEALAYYTKSIELDNQFPPPYNRIGYCNSLITN